MRSRASDFLDVRNPAAAETMVRVPLSPQDEVNESFMHRLLAMHDAGSAHSIPL